METAATQDAIVETFDRARGFMRVHVDGTAIVVDRRGRPLHRPELPRKSSGTVLPVGSQWIAHCRAGSRAAQRYLRQLEARGLFICASCEAQRPIVLRAVAVNGRGACVPCAAPVQQVGLVTIDRWVALARAGVPLRVLLDEVDVTRSCRAADDKQGWVLLLARNDQGHAYLDPERGEIAQALRTGTVVFELEAR